MQYIQKCLKFKSFRILFVQLFVFFQDKVNVCPNVRTLQTVLCEGDETIMQMNIPEYLIYASKRYCNYKAIVAAIEQSCDDVDVKFYLVIFKCPNLVFLTRIK